MKGQGPYQTFLQLCLNFVVNLKLSVTIVSNTVYKDFKIQRLKRKKMTCGVVCALTKLA